MQSTEWRNQNFDRHRYRDFFFRDHNFFPRQNSLKPRLVFRGQILRHWNRNPQKMAKVSTPVSFENEMSISGAVLSKSDLREMTRNCQSWRDPRRVGPARDELKPWRTFLFCIYFFPVYIFHPADIFRQVFTWEHSRSRLSSRSTWSPTGCLRWKDHDTGRKLASRLPCCVF